MAQFSVNPQRFDPYKNFKFRVKWDGEYVAGVSFVGPLRRHTDVCSDRSGGAVSISRQLPGLTKFDPITLERGVTHDPAFEEWAEKVWSISAGFGAETSLPDFRKNITIELYNEAGQPAKVYQVYRCWPSSYQALPDLDANSNGVAFESLVLQNEGWERDQSVEEPTEVSRSD